MPFKPHEIDYLNTADLGRLATVQRDGTPQASPVGFAYNSDLGTIDISGFNMAKSQKYRNIAVNPKVAFVVDDIASKRPWRVRCLEIRGTAAQASVPREAGPGAEAVDTAIIRITPARVISFGIDDTDTPPHQLTPDIRDF
ncbi:PPOX class F420-dependent oxidoreductase [Mycolicibacterium moriokaense]|nr:PPOX class F420-dependent oxidoreductase [Mycolicibacterium moriokaense]